METQVRKYPIGTQDFKILRENDFLYVDKTEFLYTLVTRSRQIFLSRPRRFGKSLFLSTLKYYFLGEKELFKGLKISELEKDWVEYPVFHIEFNNESYVDIHSLNQALETNLSKLEKIWGREINEKTPSSRLSGLIERAAEKTGKRVVVLVDEYDKPLLSTMDNDKLNEEFRTALKGFYGVLKSEDAYLRFAFLTGVTKFSKVSIFSDLNQLRDISMTEEFSEICGISETELRTNFTLDVERLAEKNKMNIDDTFGKLKKYYDGYHFSMHHEGMYNPLVEADNDADSCWYQWVLPDNWRILSGDSSASIEVITNGDGGTFFYSVYGVSDCGAEVNGTVDSISVRGADTVLFIVISSSRYIVKNVNNTTVNATKFNYRWYKDSVEGLFLSDAATMQITSFDASIPVLQYKLRTSISDCWSVAVGVHTGSQSSAPRKNDNNADVSIVPNPTVSTVDITLSVDYQILDIVNMGGIKQKTIDLKEKTAISVNISDLSAGTYLFRFVRNNGKVNTKKVIKH